MSTNFPNQEYLADLAKHLEQKVKANHSVAELITMYSGAGMNWISDYLTDENVTWSLEEFPIDSLTLTGTSPTWNKIILTQCERSPKKLRELMNTDSSIKEMFREATFSDTPILVRCDEENLNKLLDGMHRTVAAIRDNHATIQAYVARPNSTPKPLCEPHVVYDLLRAYKRGVTTDRAGLVHALKYLRSSFANVNELLAKRFGPDWIPDEEIQAIIQESIR